MKLVTYEINAKVEIGFLTEDGEMVRLTVYVIQRIPPAIKGTALSILTAAGDVGNALGAAMLGIVAEWFGFRWVFASAALVVLLCARYFYVTLVNRPDARLTQ